MLIKFLSLASPNLDVSLASERQECLLGPIEYLEMHLAFKFAKSETVLQFSIPILVLRLLVKQDLMFLRLHATDFPALKHLMNLLLVISCSSL